MDNERLVSQHQPGWLGWFMGVSSQSCQASHPRTLTLLEEDAEPVFDMGFLFEYTKISIVIFMFILPRYLNRAF
jgi:hypothetical protein